MSNSRPRFAEALAKMADALPPLNLQTFTTVPGSNNTLFRITASNTVTARNLTHSDYVAMASEALGNQFLLLAPSLDHVARMNRGMTDVISALVLANTLSLPVDDARIQKDFRVVSSNVFMDQEDKIWRLVGEGAGRRLVQAVKENLPALLDQRIVRKGGANTIIATAQINYTGETPQRGDYVMYWSIPNAAFRHGFATVAGDDVLVANRHDSTIEKINQAQVIACAPVKDNLPAEMISVIADVMPGSGGRPTSDDFTSQDGTNVLAYFRKLYGNHPDFFNKLEELINNRRAVGQGDQALVTRH